MQLSRLHAGVIKWQRFAWAHIIGISCYTGYYYTTQAVRGPITKINQSKCSITGPKFSKYWTGHCPEWSRTCVPLNLKLRWLNAKAAVIVKNSKILFRHKSQAIQSRKRSLTSELWSAFVQQLTKQENHKLWLQRNSTNYFQDFLKILRKEMAKSTSQVHSLHFKEASSATFLRRSYLSISLKMTTKIKHFPSRDLPMFDR